MRCSPTCRFIRTVILVIAAIVTLSGCQYHPWHDMSDPNPPWVGPGERAKRQYRFVGPGIPAPGWGEYRWIAADGRTFKANRIGKRVEKYLRSIDEFPLDILSYRRAEPRAQAAIEAGNQFDSGYPLTTPFRMTVACLDPVVVLLSPQESRYNEYRHAHVEDWIPGKYHHEGYLVLPGGAFPGTTVESTESIKWCSPDMKQPPTPVVLGDDDTASIPTGWGRLLIRYDGHTWSVEALERKRCQDDF